MDIGNNGDLNALLNRLLDEAEGTSPPAEEGGTEGPPPPAVPSAEGPSDGPQADALPAVPTVSSPAPSPLAGLLGNPALLSALPTLLENIGPLMGGLSGGTGSAPTATRPHTMDRHTALLCAVKPYLSPERQTAADTVLRLCRIWDALERSGISLSGLLGAIPVAGQGDGRDGR